MTVYSMSSETCVYTAHYTLGNRKTIYLQQTPCLCKGTMTAIMMCNKYSVRPFPWQFLGSKPKQGNHDDRT